MTRLIQSFWTKPVLGRKSDFNESRSLGGWSAPRYFYMSWALSCHRLRVHYDRVELYTDELGRHLLIDKLKLPYTHVSTSLNAIDHYGEFVWTLGKIETYRLQQEPFIHIDGDIFIWKKFDDRIHKSGLVAQNVEDNQKYYRPVVDVVKAQFDVPDWLRLELQKVDKILVANTGVVGGTHLEQIQEYTSLAFQIAKDNLKNLDLVNPGAFGVLLEQYLYYLLCQRNGNRIEYVFHDTLDYKSHPEIVKVVKAPYQNHFIHPLSKYKRQHEVEQFVELSLRTEFPETYYYIQNLISQNQLQDL